MREKLNQARYRDQHACWKFIFWDVQKYMRFLWSFILEGNSRSQIVQNFVVSSEGPSQKQKQHFIGWFSNTLLSKPHIYALHCVKMSKIVFQILLPLSTACLTRIPQLYPLNQLIGASSASMYMASLWEFLPSARRESYSNPNTSLRELRLR